MLKLNVPAPEKYESIAGPGIMVLVGVVTVPAACVVLYWKNGTSSDTCMPAGARPVVP